MSYTIIRRIRLAHCARGPLICPKCREMDREEICLLDICPPDRGLVTRRVIPVGAEGEEVWHEFDIVQVFASEKEARAYADAHGIEDVEL